MAKQFRKSAVEQYVGGFVDVAKRGSIPRRFVQKAIALIDIKLADPCCEGNDPVDTVTWEDNNLTKAIEGLLRITSKAGNVQSLTRAKAKLQHFLDGCCV